MKPLTLLPFLFLLLSSTPAVANPPLLAFVNDDFRGSKLRIHDAWSARSRFDDWNDLINSVRVPRGYEAYLYEHAEFRGAFTVVTGNWTARYDEYWYNRISSIRLVPIGHCSNRAYGHQCAPWCTDPYAPAPVVTIYEHNNFNGYHLQISGEWSVPYSDDFWNDRISAIHVPPGYAVIIYEDANFRGPRRRIEGSWMARNARDRWNDRISSLRIVRL